MLADVEQVGREAAKLAADSLWPLPDDEVVAMLRAAYRLEQTAVVLQARLVREAEGRGLPARQGCRKTAGWLRTLLRLDHSPARELAAHATRLAHHEAIEQAVLDGRIDLRQAAAIAATVTNIPDTLADLDNPTATDQPGDAGQPADQASDGGQSTDQSGDAGQPSDPAGDGGQPTDQSGDGGQPADQSSDGGQPADQSSDGGQPADQSSDGGQPSGQSSDDGKPADQSGGGQPAEHEPISLTETRRIAEQAQDLLIELAAQLPAHQLSQAAERILTHVAPELADRADERALERQQARAHRKRGLTLGLPVDGLVRLSALLDAEAAAIVQAALHPLCRPIAGDDRLMPQRRADALIEVCNLALRTGELPEDGGEPAQVAVMIPYETLTRTQGTPSQATPDQGPPTQPSTGNAGRRRTSGQSSPGTVGEPGGGSGRSSASTVGDQGGGSGQSSSGAVGEPGGSSGQFSSGAVGEDRRSGQASPSTAGGHRSTGQRSTAPAGECDRSPGQFSTGSRSDPSGSSGRFSPGTPGERSRHAGQPPTDAPGAGAVSTDWPAAGADDTAPTDSTRPSTSRPVVDSPSPGPTTTSSLNEGAEADPFPIGFLGAGITDTGQRLPASVLRRMACNARILPVVLGGQSQILDLGRSRRLANGALRRALHIRDRGCAFPQCDRPPRWTDAHHVVAWADGGPTNLDNTVLLCRHHHRVIHHPTAGWQIRLAADHRHDFIPPSTIDPLQKPQRNLFHPRH